MKKNKLNKSIIVLIIILLTLVLSCIFIRESIAKKSPNMVEFVHQSFDIIKDTSIEEIFSYDTWGYTNSDDKTRKNCEKMLCIEKGKNTAIGVETKNGAFTVYAVIDINLDGTNPNKATYYYRTADGYDSKVIEHKYLSGLAYISEWATNRTKSCSTNNHKNNSESYESTWVWVYIMENLGLRSEIDSNMPEYNTNGLNYSTNMCETVLEYVDNVESNTAETIYSARILVFSGGWSQTTALLSGGEAEPQLQINKYITKINGEDIDTDRSIFEEGIKEFVHENISGSGPVPVYRGDTVTYSIELSGANTMESLVLDKFETDAFEYVSSTIGMDEVECEEEGYTAWQTESKLKSGDFFEITLKVLRNGVLGYDTTYPNTAILVETGQESSDWVIPQVPERKINKYIVEVDGEAVEDRSEMSEDEKYDNMVKVYPGSIVKYKIELEIDGLDTEYYVRDEFDNYLNPDNYTSTWTKQSGNKLDTNDTFEENTELYVTMEVDKNAPIDEYENMAKLLKKVESKKEETEESSSDWVYIDTTVNKYITKVDGESVEDRSEMTEEEKKDNPVEVFVDSEITYRIELSGTGTTEYTVKEDWDEDKLEHVLSDLSDNYTAQLKPGESFEITLKAKKVVTLAENKVDVKDTEMTASDYVEIKEPTIDKYVISTSEELPDKAIIEGSLVSASHDDFGSITYNRAGWDDAEKFESPVGDLAPEALVTYRILIDASPNSELELLDEFDTSGLKFVSSTHLKEESTGKLKGKVKAEDYITVTLRVKDYDADVKSGEYFSEIFENTATLKKYGISSSDYISIGGVEEDARGNFKKYITEVNGKSVEDRSGYDNATAKENPVTVKQGDIVTYKIEVENDSGREIDDLELTDTMDPGLEGEDYTEEILYFGTLSEGESDSKTIDAEVTMSNMYLLPIQNQVEVTYGTYQQRHSRRHYTTETSTNDKGETQTRRVYCCTIVWYTTEEINYNWFTSNSNCDYVQLDDVELAGDVWLDSNENGKMDSGEDMISGIPVKLYSGDSVIDSTTTVDGHYSFGKVQKGTKPYSGGTRKYMDTSDYAEYTVQFEYFGNQYVATTYSDESGLSDTGDSNDWYEESHAEEINRTGFNDKFETIAYNKGYAGKKGTESATNMEYAKSGHTSMLTWTSGTTMKAESLGLFVEKGYAGGNETTCVDNEEYLQHINLGLIEKEQTDLSLKKEVEKAEVTINGYKATYNYDGALNADGTTYNSTYKIDTPHVLSIYEADYEYRTEEYSEEISDLKGGESNDLDIVLTYKVTIKNEADNELYTVLREVIDISSDSMTLISATSDDGTPLKCSTESSYNNESLYEYSGYNTHYITNEKVTSGKGFNKILTKGETITLTLTYRVDKNDGAIIVGEKANFAEVGAFSVYTDSGMSNPAGVVDKDSNPGVVNKAETDYKTTDLEDTTHYEDNSYYTVLDIVIRDGPPDPDKPEDPGPGGPGPDPDPGIPNTPEEPDPGDPEPEEPDPYDPDIPKEPSEPEQPYYNDRRITGNVWEDLNTSKVKAADGSESGQKIGNGEMDSGEKGAGNVTVLLLEVVKDGDKEYFVDTGIATKTNSKGDYVLNNIPAGMYVVRFIYGNDARDFETSTGDTIRYSGQDYKSTVYTPAGNAGAENEVIETAEFRKANYVKDGTDKHKRIQVSVARDNELRRLEVINYSTTMTYTKDAILKAQMGTEESKTLADNTAMYADTKKFNVPLEDLGNTSVTGTAEIEDVDGKKTYRFVIDEVNFGLIERPKTKLTLLDDIEEMIATTASGKEILHMYFDITYKVEGGKLKSIVKLNEEKSVGNENVQMLDRNNTTKGFRYVNIDSDLLQGMKIAVRYQIAIGNMSEIDTSRQNLIDMVYNGDVGSVATKLKTETGTPSNNYKYDGGTKLNQTLLTSYSFSNLNEAVDSISTSYQVGTGYTLGYFLGNSYYGSEWNKTTDKLVETRVDQILSYVDNDLVFKPEENLSEHTSGNVSKYLTYTIDDIVNRELLKEINYEEGKTKEQLIEKLSDSNGITYISDTKNNLAFNIEDGTVNKDLYKFLSPIGTGNISKDKLYVIDLEASRVLASEADVEDVSFDNLSEIVKVSNTVGRKTYIEFIDISSGTLVTPEKAGLLGNTPDVLPDPDQVVAEKETDTNFTETVTFSPPTGLTIAEQKVEKTGNALMIVVTVIGVVLVGALGYYLVRKKRLYK